MQIGVTVWESEFVFSNIGHQVFFPCNTNIPLTSAQCEYFWKIIFAVFYVLSDLYTPRFKLL